MRTDYRPDFSLEGKTAVVTGATKGIGYGIARLFADFGAMLFVYGFFDGTGCRIDTAILF